MLEGKISQIELELKMQKEMTLAAQEAKNEVDKRSTKEKLKQQELAI